MAMKKKTPVAGKIIAYALLLLLAFIMLAPFVWMLSASVKD